MLKELQAVPNPSLDIFSNPESLNHSCPSTVNGFRVKNLIKFLYFLQKIKAGPIQFGLLISKFYYKIYHV